VDAASFVTSLVHAAMASNFTLELMSGMHDASLLSISSNDLEADYGNLQHSYVLGSAGTQPFGSGVDSYNEGNYDYWTETLVA